MNRDITSRAPSTLERRAMISALVAVHSHAVWPKKVCRLSGRVEMGLNAGAENANPANRPFSSMWWVGMGVISIPLPPRAMLSHVELSSVLRSNIRHPRSTTPGSRASARGIPSNAVSGGSRTPTFIASPPIPFHSPPTNTYPRATRCATTANPNAPRSSSFTAASRADLPPTYARQFP
jgi:hypothetical protein